MGRPTNSQRCENDKIIEYVKRVKKNQNDQEAFEEIVYVLEGYLQHLSLKKFFFVAGHSSDDIYQEGLYALATKAIPDYDELKGPFVSFAKLCVRRHIITVLKSANNGRNRLLNVAVSLDQTVCRDEDDGPVPISGFISNGDEKVVDKIVRAESHSKLKGQLISRLTPLEARVLDLYLKNMSYNDIVEIMNRRRRNKVDAKTVDNALCRIKKKALEIEQALANGELPDEDQQQRWDEI